MFLLPDDQGRLKNGDRKSGCVVSDILMMLGRPDSDIKAAFCFRISSRKAGARKPLWPHHRAFPVNFAAMVHTHVR